MKNRFFAFALLSILASSTVSFQAMACDGDQASSGKEPSLALTEAGPTKAVFQVSGIMCKSCEKHIQAALRGVQGVKAVTFRKADGKAKVYLAEVTFENGGKVAPATLVQAVESAGFKATLTQ